MDDDDVDDGEPSRPLDDRLVDAWWTYDRLSSSGDRDERLQADEWFWAWRGVDHAVEQRVEGIVSFLVVLAEAVADDPQRLAYLGAGPLEQLLRFGRELPPPALLDEVDTAARRHESFRTALRSVWWNDGDDPATVQRFRRFGPAP